MFKNGGIHSVKCCHIFCLSLLFPLYFLHSLCENYRKIENSKLRISIPLQLLTLISYDTKACPAWHKLT